MRSFEDFVAQASASEFRLEVDVSSLRSIGTFDAFIHTPLIALAVLVITKREHSLRTEDTNDWIASVLCELCFGASDAIRRLQWSPLMRDRCAEATAFLESIGFVNIDSDFKIKITDSGKKFLVTAAGRSAEPAISLVRRLERACDKAQRKGLVLL